ncbi:hypothetical protein Bpfe_000415 [Biomphalaria pfeifferi]|uniref:Uncharacterized protein n=1 Tax=Biomphalaria pfeifferi TaxID=112525 RepID=A0AAD8CD46_BIOPF|nr:hypothetical protein Bpfe_000415 [Biomphalaria pfeifferi]
MVFYKQWCSTSNGVLLAMVFYKEWCSTSNGVLQAMVFYKQWCSTSNGVLQAMVFYATEFSSGWNSSSRQAVNAPQPHLPPLCTRLLKRDQLP